METNKELLRGKNGSGHTVWLVIATRGTRSLGIEYFETKAEAENWIKWS